MKSQILILTLTLALVACGKKDLSASSEIDNVADAAEAGLQVAGGVADEQAGSSFASRSEKSNSKYAWYESLVNQASASSVCSRAILQSCVAGVKSITYNECGAGSLGAFSVNGNVTLTFSNSSCLMGVGDNVVRTMDWTITGPRGRSIEHTSENRSNYLGETIGGGGKLTHAASTQWSIDILGKHAIGRLTSGRSLFDISVKTASSVSVAGSLDRSARVIDGGQIDVYHNLAKFTASFVPQNLSYSSTCCHPISGKMNVTYTGSISGSGSIEFNGCGAATLTRNGVAKSLELSYCE